MTSSKKDIRRSVKTVLNSLSDERKSQAAQALVAHLMKVLDEVRMNKPELLGVFSPLPTEPSIDFFLEKGAERFAFPSFIEEHRMLFYEAFYDQLLESKEFGVSLKVPPKKKLVFPKILLVPGLAFSSEGARLGRGGGYYDEYLRQHDVLKIGVCLKEQLFPSLPEEEHDQRMNYVVTDEGIIRIADASKGSQKTDSFTYKENL